MPNRYSVKVNSISTDGTNLFCEVSVFNGLHTLPPLRPVFPVGTSAASILAYLQTIADNQPALTGDIGDLVNRTINGA